MSSASFYLFSLYAFNFPNRHDTNVNIFVFVASTHPHLKKKYHTRVKRVRKYLKTVKDFDELISPQSLFLHFLGPKPSNHIWKNFNIVKKNEFTELSFLEVGLMYLYLFFSLLFFFFFW